MKTKIGFISLGCPKNQIDTEVMLAELSAAGYELTADETEADIIIVNTCAFIESAKQEAIDNILDVAWLKENRHLRGIIVTGCLAQRYKEEIFAELPEVDALVGCGSIHEIVKAVKAVDEDKKEKFSSFCDMKLLDLGGERVLTTPEYMSYLKIAEGCDNYCTYCAIPYIRGGFRSRAMEDIVEEALALEKSGSKEIVLVAQDTSRYGYDLYGSYKLAELITAVTDATESVKIRLLYCYPDKITDELLDVMATNPRVLKYIDLPLQHISPKILKAMNRHCTREQIYEVLAKLREKVPGIAVRTTAIVGFPGESEEDFTELCEFVKKAKFEHFGAFPYSREEGTVAYNLPDQIDEQTKQDRYDMIMDLQFDIQSEINAHRIGKTYPVLCEGFDAVSEAYYGRSEYEAPEIDNRIFFTSDRKIAEGEIVNVKITETMDYDLIGQIYP